MLKIPRFLAALGEVSWDDVVKHALGAVGLVMLLAWLGLPAPLAVIANAAGWFLRELWQRHAAARPLSPLGWSAGKHAEWLAPALAGLLTAIYGATQ